MNAYTPGPWDVGFGDGICGPRVSPSCFWDTEDIASIPIRHGDHAVAWVAISEGHMLSSLEPDARLIAAAPELLGALKDLDARLRLCFDAPISVAEAYDTFYQEAVLSVIAKAEGAA